MKLQGKTAVVVGASQGIGEGIARRFAEEGASVALVARGVGRAEDIARDIRSKGSNARAYGADIANVDQIERMIDAVAQDFGGIDIVCNSAAVFRTISIEETTEKLWDEQLDINLKGAFFLVKAALPHLAAAKGGKVILISSIAGERAFPNCAAYCASKGGINNLTRALALELAPKGININCIAPGNVATPMNAHLRIPGVPEYLQLLKDKTPSGRLFMTPEDISRVAVFFASDDAAPIHGATLLVDEGWSAW